VGLTGVDILHAINSFHGNCYRKRVILSAGNDIIALGNSVATKDQVSQQPGWCCSNGNGVVATGHGVAAMGNGVAAMGNGVVATGNGVAATGNGVAVTWNSVAATEMVLQQREMLLQQWEVVLQQPIYSQFCKVITLVPN